MKPLLGTRKASQVAIIVHDVEETKRAYANLLGVEVPPTVDSGEFCVTKTEYRGQPAPEAGCNMAFFDLDSCQLEIIQPNAAPSTWRDFLETYGEGVHHIAFTVENIEEGMKEMETVGELTQWGYYSDGSGAYAYFDARKSLKCFIELLCSFS